MAVGTTAKNIWRDSIQRKRRKGKQNNGDSAHRTPQAEVGKPITRIQCGRNEQRKERRLANACNYQEETRIISKTKGNPLGLPFVYK
ncbi:MAG: hypothetical protein II901_04335 [Paludibacteraceae bacterium]|nr:hypothetical protein [Paludibacteraceae bacterium]